MKKSLITLLTAAAITGTAQNWLTTLNSGATTVPKFGLSTNHALSFFTNNVERMKLTNTGRLGIGVANPAFPLDVLGDAKFSGNVLLNNSLSFSNQFKVEYTAATASQPKIIATRPWSPTPPPPIKYKAPCNVWYKDQTQYPVGGAPFSTIWQPPTDNIYFDLLQIYEPTQTISVLSLGVFNGDGILSIEPLPTDIGPSRKLKINPGCINDVFICEGGGYTKMFNGAGVVGDLDVTNRVKIGNGTFSAAAALEAQLPSFLTNAISISDPSSTATGKRIFEVTKTGKTSIGTNMQVNNSMFTVGQPVKTNLALCLTDNTTTTNKNFFNVYGNGQTFIGTDVQQTNGAMFTVGQSIKASLALSLTDNTLPSTNKDFFNVYGSGYTEIKVSPTGMPVPAYPGVTGARVFTIRDVVGVRDLFVVRADGKVYAREVEINNVANFPDYVFDKNYPLKPITEVDTYIQKNKHLPGFESAEHYEKNGLNVGDLFIKQQEKIEELMLYVIELEKRLKAVEKVK